MKAEEAESPKGPWSYAPLSPRQARWYWTKPPFSRKGEAQVAQCVYACEQRFCKTVSAAKQSYSIACMQLTDTSVS